MAVTSVGTRSKMKLTNAASSKNKTNAISQDIECGNRDKQEELDFSSWRRWNRSSPTSLWEHPENSGRFA